jgi:predicted RecA/RadA family phage recombinase
MLVTFVQEGTNIDYIPGADVDAGDVVVQNDLVGVANRNIKSGEQGALAVAGVFEFPKATGGSTAIAAGVSVYWDVAEQVAKADDESGANNLIGKTIAAATDAATHVRVRMSQ